MELTGEAIGTAALIAALQAHLGLAIEAPADSTWLANAARAMEVASEWWKYERIVIAAPNPVPASGPAGGAALCFTGGVDSFHSLLFGARPIDFLLYVQGYDVPLNDVARLASIERDLVAVADATGKLPLLTRTNYREVPVFAAPWWERSHGAALAAVGHLLVGGVGTLLISAADHYAHPRAWGSSWALDHLWSSSRLAVGHVGVSSAASRRLSLSLIRHLPAVTPGCVGSI